MGRCLAAAAAAGGDAGEEGEDVLELLEVARLELRQRERESVCVCVVFVWGRKVGEKEGKGLPRADRERGVKGGGGRTGARRGKGEG